MSKYGLIGGNLSYSYSKIIHESLYNKYKLNNTYDLIETTTDKLETVINKLKTNEYSGFNVTIPFKEEVLKYVDEMSNEVKDIKSCNTLIYKDGKVIAHNTDIFGFNYLLNYFDIKLNNCFILGSGATCKTVSTLLNKLKVEYKIISRNHDTLNYDYINNNIKNETIINTTPIGTYPNIESVLTKEVASKANQIIDLIYNPKETLLMSYNKQSYNGLIMLVAQAFKAFEIFTNNTINDNDIKNIIKEIEVRLYE